MSRSPDMDALPRGIRNHNPGNIRKSADSWKGLIEYDPEYCQFFTPQHGIRAMARILINYEKLYGLNTVTQIIWRWAPPDDGNATAIYADFVARRMGVNRNTPLNVKDNLVPLIKAMIEFENGVQPYDVDTIAEGITMALSDT